MKRLICLILSLCMLLCLCACTEKKVPATTGAIESIPAESQMPTEGGKVPIDSLDGIRKEPAIERESEKASDSPTEGETKPLSEGISLPSFDLDQIPDPAPVEPSTEVADS